MAPELDHDEQLLCPEARRLLRADRQLAREPESDPAARLPVVDRRGRIVEAVGAADLRDRVAHRPDAAC